MKQFRISTLLALLLTLSFTVIGCKKGPKGPTPIPGARTQSSNPGSGSQFPSIPPGGRTTDGNAGIVDPNAVVRTDSGIETANRDKWANAHEDREIFKANTVFFEFDRSAIRASEQSKIDDVANWLKANSTSGLRIEGHCDERGTEEYNRALGERRAQALREYLVNLGISPDRILTVSYGEDKPADTGHDDAAWAKNRRGEFILLKP